MRAQLLHQRNADAFEYYSVSDEKKSRRQNLRI